MTMKLFFERKIYRKAILKLLSKFALIVLIVIALVAVRFDFKTKAVGFGPAGATSRISMF